MGSLDPARKKTKITRGSTEFEWSFLILDSKNMFFYKNVRTNFSSLGQTNELCQISSNSDHKCDMYFVYNLTWKDRHTDMLKSTQKVILCIFSKGTMGLSQLFLPVTNICTKT